MFVWRALCDELEAEGITLITHVRSNMKAKALSLWDKLMLRKRFLIETVVDQLKNISQIAQSAWFFIGNRRGLNCLYIPT